VASSCARSVTLGYEEAIEVMVLDGVDRARATCIVSSLEEELDLAKVTGLDIDLDEGELAALAAASSRCAPALAAVGGVVGGSPLIETSLAEELGDGVAVDVQAEIYRMVEEGLDPTLADCLIVGLSVYPEPADVLADDLRFSGMVVDCREQL
jgi:hypothetical protein